MSPQVLLDLAVEAAKVGSDPRSSCHGAVGIRGDGAVVMARNGTAANLTHPLPSAHAERRLLRKLGLSSPAVYVARVTRDGCWAMSRPCPTCMAALKNYRVRVVYYTVGANEYGFLRLA